MVVLTFSSLGFAAGVVLRSRSSPVACIAPLLAGWSCVPEIDLLKFLGKSWLQLGRYALHIGFRVDEPSDTGPLGVCQV